MKSKYSDDVPEYKDSKYFGYKAQHEALRSLPFDVYCVGQSESYFADEKTQYDMLFNPEKYLKEHALFAARNGEVTMAERGKPGHKELNYDFKPISEEEAKELIGQMTELYQETIKQLSIANK